METLKMQTSVKDHTIEAYEKENHQLKKKVAPAINVSHRIWLIRATVKRFARFGVQECRTSRPVELESTKMCRC